jgi:hypothetical protein
MIETSGLIVLGFFLCRVSLCSRNAIYEIIKETILRSCGELERTRLCYVSGSGRLSSSRREFGNLNGEIALRERYCEELHQNVKDR